MNTIKKVGTLSLNKNTNARNQGAQNNRQDKRSKKPLDNKNDFNSRLKKKQSNAEMLIATPYERMEVPEINKDQRKKVGTSMQRRLSIHMPKDGVSHIPDYSNAPALPGALSAGVYGSNDMSMSLPKPAARQHFKPTFDSTVLRNLLSNNQFDTAQFIHDKLGDATVREIDNFTSSLNDLQLEVHDEVEMNMDKSYKEIIVVNKNLETTTSALKAVRKNIEALEKTLRDFKIIATKKIEKHKSLQQQQPALTTPKLTSAETFGSLNSSSASNEAKVDVKVDKTSVHMLEKIWINELNALWKQVEGSQKYVPAISGRHIILESSDWIEVNVATLKHLNYVHLVVLNDLIVVATRKSSQPSNKDRYGGGGAGGAGEPSYAVSQCSPLNNVSISPNENNLRLTMTFNNDNVINKSIFQCKSDEEFQKCVQSIRAAKDNAKETLSSEEQTANKIRNSLFQLQNSPANIVSSPIKKTHNRTTSSGSSVMGFSSESGNVSQKNKRYSSTNFGTLRNGEKDDISLIHSLSMSMNARSKTRDLKSPAYQLKQIDETVDSIDVFLYRKKFKDVLKIFDSVQKSLAVYDGMGPKTDEVVDDEQGQVLRQFLDIKIQDKKTVFVEKLMAVLQTPDYLSDIDSVIEATNCMISSDYVSEYTILDLFLSNRSQYINYLLSNIESTLLDTHVYIIEITVIKFQILTKTAMIFNNLFGGSSLFNQLSSTLVSWTSSEIDAHFAKVASLAHMESIITPSFIKTSRRQIDFLKSVGMDFVYKLDKFLSQIQQEEEDKLAKKNVASDAPSGLGFVEA